MRRLSFQAQLGERIVVVSDIHAHLSYLKALFQEIDLQPQDHLIILGDFINRGEDSLECLRYVKDLRDRPSTYILKGNHEHFVEMILESSDNLKAFEDFYGKGYYETLFNAMLNHENTSLSDFKTPSDLYDFFHETYKEEIDFIKSLDIILEDKDYLFVHGGYDASFKEDEVFKFLKYDEFDRLSPVQDKTVVVGHWPACNLREDKLDNRPYFNPHKNLIFVDGGLGIKSSGELSCLIIHKMSDGDHYSSVQVNAFQEAVIVKERHYDQEDHVFISYPNNEIKLLHQGQDMSQGLHIHTGKTFTVFNDMLVEKDKGHALKGNYSNHFLNLDLGKRVFRVNQVGDYVLVKCEDDFGWVHKDQLEDVKNEE